MIDPNKARKRSDPQIEWDRLRMAELLLKGYNQSEVRDIIEDETGVSLSLTTIRNDIKAIRKEWKRQRVETYDEMVNREEARLDSLESELWAAWRSSCQDNEKEIVERVAKQVAETPEEAELILRKVTTMTDKKNGVGDSKIMSQIIDVQKERRRLRGLYAPSQLGINVNTKSELLIKGYAVPGISPDAWPESADVVEGEYAEPPMLESGK